MGARPRKRAKSMPKNVLDKSHDTTSCSAQEFWDEYVCKREPKLIEKMPVTNEWNTAAWVKDFPEYFKKQAGSLEVQVESRENTKGNFGLGYKRTMTFSNFLQRLSEGDTSLYLTTQEVKYVEKLQAPNLRGKLMQKLQGDFPAVPEILGNLVPHQVNPWIGAAPEGSSTGLHHDYHDNLYCVLKGRKRFRVFPPEMAPQLYTHGQIHKIYPNGRIVYKGWAEDTRADGARGAEYKVLEARYSAEKELQAAEAEVAKQKAQKGAPSREALARLKEAEDDLEEVIQENLDLFVDEDPNLYEDYDGDDAYGNGETDEGSDKGRNEGDWSNEEGYCEAGVYTRGKRDRDLVDLSGPGEFYEDTVDWPLSGQFHGDGDWAEEQAEKVVALPDEEKSWPDSFSKIRDLDMGDADLKRKFPLFPGKAAAREIMVTEGQMLYLPAGWFHEVTSYGKQHIALSYWMHPPDNLKPGPDGFQKPYTGLFWQETYRRLCAQA